MSLPPELLERGMRPGDEVPPRHGFRGEQGAAAPFVPHLAESLWVVLGHHTLVASASWHAPDPSLLCDTMIVWPIQVDGRKRSELRLPPDAEARVVEAAALARLQEALAQAGTNAGETCKRLLEAIDMDMPDLVHAAEDAAIVDQITGGRMILSVGVGYQERDFSAFGLSIKERAGRSAEPAQ